MCSKVSNGTLFFSDNCEKFEILVMFICTALRVIKITYYKIIYMTNCKHLCNPCKKYRRIQIPHKIQKVFEIS